MRNKHAILVSIICILFMLFTISPSYALFDSDVDKAKDFMAVGMYPQAIELLNKRINEKPKDAEAHFQLGICFINTGNYSGADARFGSSVQLEPEYGYKIGGEYKKAGSLILGKGQVRQAKELFQKAAEYQPGLKATISQEVYALGEEFFKQGKYDEADSRFLLAVEFDPSLNQQICDKYYELGQKADDAQCISYYLRTKKFNDTYNKQIGERLLAISKKQKSDNEIQRWRTEAAKFVEVPPDYKEYPRGTYTFSLKAGEETDLWITFPKGVKYGIKSADDKFKLKYYDGEVVPAWTPGNWPNKYKFKIIAVEDQPSIKLRVY